jgi:hypothetical protein
MEKKVFEIREFSLIGGKTLYTYLEREDLVFDEQRQVFKDKEGFVQQRNNYFLLTTDLSRFNKEDLFPAGTELLPFKAKVIQDLPSSVAKHLDPEEYPNCQLMGEKHGGYLQFKNLDNGEVLRIAMNSNYYEPTK